MKSLNILGTPVPSGSKMRFSIPVAHLFDYTDVSISLEVFRGKEDGPTVFVSASLHGDEIIGTEITRRLLLNKQLKKLKGTLIVIPIVNPYGYNNNTRYLPDRRDLNRSFPGSNEGSLAARVANTFLTEVVEKCDYGIDIHSGAIHRTNLPQIRVDFKNTTVMNLAEAFNPPLILNSPNRAGTLRATAFSKKVDTLLFEVGEALRYDELGIKTGVNGILNVLRALNMLPTPSREVRKNITLLRAHASYWLRAPESGNIKIIKKLGQLVEEGDLLAQIYDPFGKVVGEIKCSKAGIVIGASTMPLVNSGNAVFHIAVLDQIDLVSDSSLILDQDIDIEYELWYEK